MMARRVGQVVQIKERFIGHRVRFQIAPNVFRGIQLWSIRWQELRSPSLRLGEVVLNQAGPVSQEPIP